VLSMDRNGVIKINQNEIQASHLIEELQHIFKTRSDRTIFVQGDDELLFSDMARLIDAAQGAGMERLGLVTEKITIP
jgi:biopolymer transport protein TolR